MRMSNAHGELCGAAGSAVWRHHTVSRVHTERSDAKGKSGQGSMQGNYIGTWLGTMGTREGAKEVILVSKRREEEEEMRACRLACASASHLRACQQPREGGRSSRKKEGGATARGECSK